jgi:type II secretory pathway predicted ATPase ExeA
MFNTYFGMKCNPFRKDINIANTYELTDFKEVQGRLSYLQKTKGIGLFTGSAGLGKTYSVRYFCSKLNPSLYKVVYLPLSTVTVIEFYRGLCRGLGIEPKTKKVDMFVQIQQTIKSLCNDRKITPVIAVDEAQYLSTDVLNDLKMLFNFDMDSKNLAILILVGQPILNDILSRNVHEPLKQRIVVNYSFVGMSKEEIDLYIKDRLRLSGVNENIFQDSAITAIASNSNGSTRKLNSLVEKCLLICAQKQENIVSAETIMLADNDINFV